MSPTFSIRCGLLIVIAILTSRGLRVRASSVANRNAPWYMVVLYDWHLAPASRSFLGVGQRVRQSWSYLAGFRLCKYRRIGTVLLPGCITGQAAHSLHLEQRSGYLSYKRRAVFLISLAGLVSAAVPRRAVATWRWPDWRALHRDGDGQHFLHSPLYTSSRAQDHSLTDVPDAGHADHVASSIYFMADALNYSFKQLVSSVKDSPMSQMYFGFSRRCSSGSSSAYHHHRDDGLDQDLMQKT
jgi:hypothetical protein